MRGLSQLLIRERLLLFGEEGTGKTYSLLGIALAHPQSLCYIIDPDAGVAKVLEELGGAKQFPNVEYAMCPGWPEIYKAFNEAHAMLKKGDWLFMEHLGRVWEKAQDFYSVLIYKTMAPEHLLTLKQAKAEGEKVALLGSFGEEGDWRTIRSLHSTVVDRAALEGIYNIAATSAIRPLNPKEVGQQWAMVYEGAKPEGEKHNGYRADTIAQLTRKPIPGSKPPAYTYLAKILKDKGRKVGAELDTTDRGFWGAYKEE